MLGVAGCRRFSLGQVSGSGSPFRTTTGLGMFWVSSLLSPGLAIRGLFFLSLTSIPSFLDRTNLLLLALLLSLSSPSFRWESSQHRAMRSRSQKGGRWSLPAQPRPPFWRRSGAYLRSVIIHLRKNTKMFVRVSSGDVRLFGVRR